MAKNDNFIEEVRLAFEHLKAPLSEEDFKTYVNAKNLRYSRMGILSGDSSGFAEETYLSDYQLYARWLLGQFRDIAEAPSFALPRFMYMETWMGQADRFLILATEIWKDIPDYSNYEVSNRGLVRNKKTGRVLKQFFNTPGVYFQVDLSKNGKAKKHLVHRLVAQAFLSNYDSRYAVKHIGSQTSNLAGNLKMSGKMARRSSADLEKEWKV